MPPTACAAAATMNVTGSACASDIWPSMAASVMVHTCWPTVMQQFRRAICKAVLTCFPSCSARLLRTAIKPNGMAKDPTSGSTENAMHTSAKRPFCLTKKAARTPTMAPPKMHGAYTSLGGILVCKSTRMMTREDTSPSTALHCPPCANCVSPLAYASCSGEPGSAVSSPPYTDTPNHCPAYKFHEVRPIHTRHCTKARW
mmetsp:Transcript_38396/g.109855  ORF Transcript_38396/g.109855 Transcript_38396/m.109855 type:complete len:200 (-) Transcript_38396:836-1435(-)